jgi:hypothetical protein
MWWIPDGTFQDRVAPFAFHAAGFLRADFVERLVHIGGDICASLSVSALKTASTFWPEPHPPGKPDPVFPPSPQSRLQARIFPPGKA